MRLFTAGLVSSIVVTSALFVGCSNDSGGSGSGGTGGSSGSGGSSGNGGSGGSGAAAPGGGGEAGNTDASGGSSATGGNAGEAGATGIDASGGTSDTGGSGGTGGGGTGGDTTGGTGGGGTGGDATGGTGAHGGTGGSGGTGGKSGMPSPNIGCMGSVATDTSHELTSCGLSISKIGGQAQFTFGLQGKDENNDGLTLTLQFTDVPSTGTYSFEGSNYMEYTSTWNEGTTIYVADAYEGAVGVGSLSVEIDTIDGPFMAGSTTFYTATGSITGSLEDPPSPTSAVLDLTF